MRNEKTKRLTVTAMMLALAAALALVCAFLPFLHLPFGGGFTIASMLPIVIVAYMYGAKWGFFTSFTYAVVQILLDLCTGAGSSLAALFTPTSDEYMGGFAAVAVLVLDYLVAYGVLGVAAVARRMKRKSAALAVGAFTALFCRYLAHIVSGAVFYGAWAEWFFTQEGFYRLGEKLLGTLSGTSLAVVYSAFYNGLYMIPEIVITVAAAVFVSRISAIRRSDLPAMERKNAK